MDRKPTIVAADGKTVLRNHRFAAVVEVYAASEDDARRLVYGAVEYSRAAVDWDVKLNDQMAVVAAGAARGELREALDRLEATLGRCGDGESETVDCLTDLMVDANAVLGVARRSLTEG